jgi:hypothetical protein
MTYTALAIVFMLASIAIGARSRSTSQAEGRAWPVIVLAATMVLAQFALLVAQ